jgi:type IV pilus assembly protein PilC
MMLVFLVLIVGALVCSGFVRTWSHSRNERKRLVLQTITAVVARNLPLGRSLQAAAAGERGGLRRSYLEIARRLETGDSLTAALHSSGVAVGGDVLGAVQAAERGGTLPAVLQSLAAQERRPRPQAPGVAVALWYVVAVALVLLTIATFLGQQVLPSLEAICADFGISVPAETMQAMETGDAFAVFMWLILLVVGSVFVLYLLQLFGNVVVTRVPGRPQVLHLFIDAVVWALPGFRWSAASAALARQLAVMQAAVRNGHPLSEAVHEAALVATNCFAQQRMSDWARALERGDDPLAAAQRCGIPEPVRRALRGGGTPADVGARLEYLADYYDRLLAHWRTVILRAILPFLVVACGLMIGSFVYAVFLPLVRLIEAVIESVPIA